MNKRSTEADWIDPDDAPDLSTPEWKAKVDAAPVRRGDEELQEPPAQGAEH